MARQSKIGWTDSTVNLWIGCTEVGPGCRLCYAALLSARRGWAKFGKDEPRHRTKTWNAAKNWQKEHRAFFALHERRQRVFCLSLGDFMDNEIPVLWRVDGWKLIRNCPDLEWQILTKRSGNVEKMLPSDWGPEYAHIILIFTICNQDEADRDVPRLIALKAKYPWLRIGLSCEPMLGPITLKAEWLRRLNWVICGGESGTRDPADPKDKPAQFHIAWARALMQQCLKASVPFFMKQMGTFPIFDPGDPHANYTAMGKWDSPQFWPEDLRVQKFPEQAPDHVLV